MALLLTLVLYGLKLWLGGLAKVQQRLNPQDKILHSGIFSWRAGGQHRLVWQPAEESQGSSSVATSR